MQIWAESGKSALPICNYSQILYQFLTFTQNLKRSPGSSHKKQLINTGYFHRYKGYRFFVSSSHQKNTAMLAPQERLAFSDYSSLYDLIIPQDNLLRRINSLIDFSFVYNELVS